MSGPMTNNGFAENPWPSQHITDLAIKNCHRLHANILVKGINFGLNQKCHFKALRLEIVFFLIFLKDLQV